MKLCCLQHVAFEGPAWIASWAEVNAITLYTADLYRNAALPPGSEFDGLVVMGGPMGTNDEYRHHWMAPEKKLIARAVEAGKPVLGICLGAQLIAAALGSKVYPNPRKEIGWFPVDKAAEADRSPFGADLPQRFTAFHWHGDTFDLPTGAVRLAQSQACTNQAFAIESHVLGLQFHLEATQASITALVENCREDLVPASAVQNEQDIRTGFSYLDGTHAVMARLLDRLFKAP